MHIEGIVWPARLTNAFANLSSEEHDVYSGVYHADGVILWLTNALYFGYALTWSQLNPQ